VPLAALTPEERRLAAFCRAFAVVYFASAACVAVLPLAAPHALGGLASTLATALLAAAATACLVTAARPRERRHAILPVAVAQLTACVLAAAHLVAGRTASLGWLLAIGLLLLALTVGVYRASALGVHSAPAREGPVLEKPAPKVQLKLSK
jgi:hypothetical protein